MFQIEIKSTEWTYAEIARGYADDEMLTAEQINACADSEYAWLINYTHKYMPGWSYTDGTFTGPARNDAIAEILNLFVEAGDYVVEHMDEILADA